MINLPSPNPSGGRKLVSGGQVQGISLQTFALTQPGTEGSDSSLEITASAVGVIESLSNKANIALEGPIYDADNIARWYVYIQVVQAQNITIQGYARHVCYNSELTKAYFGPELPFEEITFTIYQFQGGHAFPFTIKNQDAYCESYSKGTPAYPGFPIHATFPGFRRRLNGKQRELGVSETDCLTGVTATAGESSTSVNPVMSFSAGFNHTGAPNCHGDPHFVTWQGNRFDFHGECDLVYLHAPEFRGLGMSIHLRTTMRGEFSYVDVAALQIGSDVLELGSHKGQFLLNGKLADPAKDNMIAGFSISYSQDPTKKMPYVTLDVDLGEGEIIRFRQLRNIVSVYILGPKRDDFEAGVGLVGSFSTGGMLARDGQTTMDDPNAFGQEWQVRDTEPQLFQEIRAPQYPQQCIMPSVSVQDSRRRRLEAGITDEEAQSACAGLSEDAYNDCMYDVIMSGDVSMATAYVF